MLSQNNKMIKNGNDLKYKAYQWQTNCDWENFGQWHNTIKQKLKETNTHFYKKFYHQKTVKLSGKWFIVYLKWLMQCHSYKKQKDCLEGSLDRVLFAT